MMILDFAPDVAFAGLVVGHAAIGEGEVSHAVRRKVVDIHLNFKLLIS